MRASRQDKESKGRMTFSGIQYYSKDGIVISVHDEESGTCKWLELKFDEVRQIAAATPGNKESE